MHAAGIAIKSVEPNLCVCVWVGGWVCVGQACTLRALPSKASSQICVCVCVWVDGCVWVGVGVDRSHTHTHTHTHTHRRWR